MICMFRVIHYCLQMCLKIKKKTCLKVYELDPPQFLSAPGLVWQACLKKKQV